MTAERPIRAAELRRNRGERGTRMWVAVGGVVYDVTDCARWQSGLHEGQHFPGQELTDELGEAPHGADVQRVGRLQDEQASPA